ncbi:hypothetical protein JSY36_09835 [Bacillus sp. H-16]|uniref:hypothetical protein n=1 Tax=Alteribacter salitolerans TaxID=2912333 RepID=UPI0019655900|nr:hypothetical protein [Alteribacter salitolerans]MBM7096055.1 hypothetical protein [Alteribacter salitolerans]
MSNLERLCIEVDKLYDWVTRSTTKSLTFSGEAGLADLDFDCDGEEGADPCEFLPEDGDYLVTVVENDDLSCAQVGPRRDVFFPELGIELQEVKIRKQGSFFVELRLEEDGPVICTSGDIEFCLFETFYLCAPEETDVVCEVYDFFGDGVICCTNGQFSSLELSLLICQQVKVVGSVIIEIEGRPCRPRRHIMPQPVDIECPAIVFPRQCPEVFPGPHNHDDSTHTI